MIFFYQGNEKSLKLKNLVLENSQGIYVLCLKKIVFDYHFGIVDKEKPEVIKSDGFGYNFAKKIIKNQIIFFVFL